MRNMAVLHSPAFSYPLPVLVRVLFNLLIFKGKILYYNKYMENPELVRLLLVGEDPVYQIADNMPEFPRGMTACLQYLARNIKYPVIAQKEGAQGKVIVQMVIEKDGSVDHVSIVRSITPELDAEAARVVKSMPKWKPATVKDKAVRCRYTVPVTFKLQ